MAKTKEKEHKSRKKLSRTAKENWAIGIVALLILSVVVYECYTATHVRLQTYTAKETTVYRTIETTALAVREEHTVSGPGGVTVQCVADGEKIAKDGKVALRFQSEADAKAYSQRTALKEKLQHYRDMENKSTATATDITAVDNEAVQNVNDYIRALAQSDLTGASTAAQEMNDTFTRRQMMIGTSIDFAALKRDLQSQMDGLGTAEPIGSVTAAVSGVFSGYTDGCESVFDYDRVTEMTAADLDKALKTAESAKGDTGALGKVITSYAWYFVCKADVADLQKVQNGTRLDVAIKDSDRVLSCTVVSGADTKPGTTQTVLVLQCENMDSDIAAYRAEDIEIRTASYTGIKAPAAAVHVSDGKKGVYVLVAGQVKFRPATVLYSGKDYVILAYDAQNKDGIRLYDEIITEGKDLYNGKVYT